MAAATGTHSNLTNSDPMGASGAVEANPEQVDQTAVEGLQGRLNHLLSIEAALAGRSDIDISTLIADIQVAIGKAQAGLPIDLTGLDHSYDQVVALAMQASAGGAKAEEQRRDFYQGLEETLAAEWEGGYEQWNARWEQRQQDIKDLYASEEGREWFNQTFDTHMAVNSKKAAAMTGEEAGIDMMKIARNSDELSILINAAHDPNGSAFNKVLKAEVDTIADTVVDTLVKVGVPKEQIDALIEYNNANGGKGLFRKVTQSKDELRAIVEDPNASKAEIQAAKMDLLQLQVNQAVGQATYMRMKELGLSVEVLTGPAEERDAAIEASAEKLYEYHVKNGTITRDEMSKEEFVAQTKGMVDKLIESEGLLSMMINEPEKFQQYAKSQGFDSVDEFLKSMENTDVTSSYIQNAAERYFDDNGRWIANSFQSEKYSAGVDTDQLALERAALEEFQQVMDEMEGLVAANPELAGIRQDITDLGWNAVNKYFKDVEPQDRTPEDLQRALEEAKQQIYAMEEVQQARANLEAKQALAGVNTTVTFNPASGRDGDGPDAVSYTFGDISGLFDGLFGGDEKTIMQDTDPREVASGTTPPPPAQTPAGERDEPALADKAGRDR